MNENILLVEDEDALRITLSDRLRGEGYVVDSAKDGEEGLEKVTSSPFDLLILDVMLPHRSGFDICRDIRQAGLATPILFLTARNELVDKVVGFKLGGDDYVTKPFEAPELMVRIEATTPPRTGAGGTRSPSDWVLTFTSGSMSEPQVSAY
jgi:two-component system, OmpR family, alkaline phosphatase synthesis response regulator PhoP